MLERKRSLFWPALWVFLALPGVVAFLVPWLLRPSGARLGLAGFSLIGLGLGLLLWCVRDFYVAGHGTLAPWTPPTQLITVGLYRASRNPMYVAVVIILVGFAIGYESLRLWVYAAVVALMVHLRVVTYEEPRLARSFGQAWFAYRARVPRWIGRSTRATGSKSVP